MEAGNPRAAVVLYRAVLARHPRDAMLFHDLAVAARAAGDGAEADGRNRHRHAAQLAALGGPDPGLDLILRAPIVWQKVNGLPESVRDRVRVDYELVFHFTKAPRYYAAIDEVRDQHAESSWARAHLPKKISPTPLADMTGGAWQECRPETVGGWTAVGTFFGRHLQERAGVPIGLVHASWGGTVCEAWAGAEALADWAHREGLVIIGIDNLPGSVPIETVHLPRRCVLLFGQEGPGLTPAARTASALVCSIAQYGSTRSINAGVAGGIAMHTWIRQHATPPGLDA